MNMFARLTAVAGLVLSLLGGAPRAQAEDLFLPDLTMTTQQYMISDGQEVVEIKIKNSGLGYAGPFSVFVGGNTHTNEEEIRKYPGLAAGAEIVFAHKPGFASHCDFWRLIILDYGKQVVEKFEDNNTVQVYAKYCPRPDMQVTMTTVNLGGGLNEYQRITVANNGKRDAFNYTLKITSSGGSNTGTQHTIAVLSAGASTSFNFYPKSNCYYAVTASITPPIQRPGVYDDFNMTNNSAKADDSCLR